MAEVDTLALVTFFSGGRNDPSTTDRYYNDTIIELAEENWTCDAQAFAVTPGQTEINLGTMLINVVNLLGIIYDDREIDEIPLRQLEMLDPYWRSSTGLTTTLTPEAI